MGPAAYVMAILGCADGGASCQTVATMSARYESPALCTAAQESVLDANSDLDFPTLIAECRASGATPASAETTNQSNANSVAA